MDHKVIALEKDDRATKLLVSLGNFAAEVVAVRRPEKNIICFSTMIGCPIGCKFCVSGLTDFYMHKLTVDEMKALIRAASDYTSSTRPTVYSAMGEGEPALNLPSVIQTLNEVATGFGDKKALSTSGPNLASVYRTVHLCTQNRIKLQYSLHAAGKKRERLIPRAHTDVPIILGIIKDAMVHDGLIAELNITLMHGVNDSLKDLDAILMLLASTKRDAKVPWYIKLNHFNEIPNSDLRPSKDYVVSIWDNCLREAGHTVEYYQTDGAEINAACGQLHYHTLVKH